MTRIGWVMVVVLAALLSLECGPALADGHSLLMACKMVRQKNPTDYNALESGLCIGLIQGVRQTLVAYTDLLPKEHRVCVPRSVNNEQSVGVVVNYLETHPNQLYLPETALAIQAHREAYTCK
jgi:hypothetical protein